ncbi:MAG: heparinase II/III family protein [Planctomycetes bacterium]|nr:heparinase II/III family protein [Planctomycetota bacterium]
MPLSHLRRFLRTVRHLRPSQVVWRGRYALARRFRPRDVPLPEDLDWSNPSALLREDFPRVPLLHRRECDGSEVVEHLAEGEFSFLNHRERLGPPPVEWKLGPQSVNRLWTITLHYHEWAYELTRAGALFEEYLADWIERCDLATPGARHLAWNAFAVSTRISWWIRAWRELDGAWWAERPQFRTRFLQSLWRQAEFVSRHLEWDLRGNHLLRNAVGLAWAGRFFRGKRPDAWLAAATELAVAQVREQVLADGGHFERSPMYHVHIMEDVLSLALLLEDAAAQSAMRDAWLRMADWLRWVRHPDGEIPLLNDAALDAVAHPSAMLLEAPALLPPLPRGGWGGSRTSDAILLVHRSPLDDHTPLDPPLPPLSKGGNPEWDRLDSADLPTGGRHLPDTGLVVWHDPLWSVFFDVGPVGPDFQPGHAHADTLSVECSFRGRRLFVDAGTWGYDRDERRSYDRSTAAHNTLAIDGCDSSEVWDIFRVGSRAKTHDVCVQIEPDSCEASAGHDGFSRLPGSPRHWRRVAIANGALSIIDRVEGGGAHRASGGWLLAPGWHVEAAEGGWTLRNDSGTPLAVTITSTSSITLESAPAAYHPQFGLEWTTTRLLWNYEGVLPLQVTTFIAPGTSSEPRSQHAPSLASISGD